ncbi:Kynurenine formamidase [Nocardioides terrae]|uniref:Kynurenine formamidase n=1 Tax=Nocardioides terrae TaxID=574651 RepID=A0A1I1DQ26_9ACTN|nr:arylformamidase [Nocardioides terrae]SFB76944.1 Kynurenine formamidase [Nocardioides terrae]
MTTLWDITPTVDVDSPVFPGDQTYDAGWTFRIGPGCPVNVARLTLSPHTGAHADAPLHYAPDGTPAGALDLTPFLGPCRVVHATSARPLVTPADVAHALDEAMPPRLLIRTYDRQPTAWDDDFAGLEATLLDELGSRGGILVGTDGASLDPADSKTLDAHRAAHRHDLRILENLLLDDVPEGDYELIALPLKLATADAAPVRAVLRELV